MNIPGSRELLRAPIEDGFAEHPHPTIRKPHAFLYTGTGSVTSPWHQDSFEPALQNLAKEKGHHKVTSDFMKVTVKHKPA